MKIKRIVVGPIEANCFLFVCGSVLAVIDPGDDDDRIFHEIKNSGARPVCIINTHYHFDHTLGNKALKKKIDVPVIIHENEKDYLDFSPDRFLADGEKIKVGECCLKVLLTPGHSAGSICLFAPGIVFSGDTIFESGVGRWDLPGGSLDDLKISLEKLNDEIEPGTTIYPGHGEIFTFQKQQWI